MVDFIRRSKSRGSWKSAIAALALAMLFGALAIFEYSHSTDNNWALQYMAAFSGFSLLAAVLRLGWSIPCMLLGCFLGTILGIRPGSGPEDDMWVEVSSLATGTLIGLVIGVVADVGSERRPGSESTVGVDPDSAPPCT